MTSPITVLLVEDNAVNAMIATAMLTKLGCKVTPARDGEQAVEATKTQHFDLVLMDCNMPVMDGFEATKAIRALEQGGQARHLIVAQTGDVSEGDREACLAAGMDDYIAKPIKTDELAALLGRYKK